MKSRVSLLAEIVGNPLPNSATLRTLKEYGWDCDSELVIVSMTDVLAILSIFRAGKINSEQVYDWANRLEGRDDIGYQFGFKGVVNDAIFWLANPHINDPIDEKLCKRIETIFSKASIRHFTG
jgi:hypothetical protein